MELADHFVANPNAPEVKVCGTGIKMTVYLLGRCGEGSLTAARWHTLGPLGRATPVHLHQPVRLVDLHLISAWVPLRATRSHSAEGDDNYCFSSESLKDAMHVQGILKM